MQAGLKRASRKSFCAETTFKAWGAEIDGILGPHGVPPVQAASIGLTFFCLEYEKAFEFVPVGYRCQADFRRRCAGTSP